MSELRICRICLSTGVKLYRMDRFQLKAYYEEVMALQVNESDQLPQYFCYECATMLQKFHKFKEKCYCAQKAFKEMLWKGPISYDAVKVDRVTRNISSILEFVKESDLVKYYDIKEDDNNSAYIKSEDGDGNKIEIEIITNNYNEQNTNFNVIENDPVAIDIGNEVVIENEQNETVFVDVTTHIIKEEPGPDKKKKSWTEQDVMKYHSITNRRTRFLDANHWKKYTLTEEEALKEFKFRSQEMKYLKAAHKCTDCYKGFSKEEMLIRHAQLRHSATLGVFECRFCKMRFRWDSHLRIHMRQHFTKYQCLRCNFVCPLENSAILHEEYHSGVTRKCIHCGEEFRHASTYYTHLRTSHRSGYICSLCGVSFVSETGLHQHKKVKHVTLDFDSPDDDEEVNTYCAPCGIRFETRKAYEEHLFHSLMHADGVEDEIQDEVTIPRKVLGKRLRAKITKEIRKRKECDEIGNGGGKRKKKMKRRGKKPTRCYQCGQEFETQSACMKHHISEHPRTSFYPDTARHICEICGASLAPGSVAVHQNMHTREKVFSCDSCGRQFHSTVGLRRHLVTHTGEKRFGCSLCDKRFTQSNSMKLHYRTFHLKQPYPKRNRKKKDAPVVEVESTSEEEEERSELDSLPDPNPEPLEPAPMHLEPEHDDTVQYLTLE